MPINRKIGVDLAFTADTKQAQQQLNVLRDQLTQLINTAPQTGFAGFTKELQNASASAATLKTQLESAINVNTGKLDLGKFQQSLKTSGITLEDYKNQLTSLGPQGVAAFGQLSQAIMNAEMPLRRSSQLLTDFATTLKNTARWQISSSLLHGFMGSVQTAYYYAQDLNESLNNIRIVTGKNTDEMAAFAKQANEAAKNLSTTTTEYTDASLIYYQQGLSDQEVQERTDVTIKMANVARESAEIVSQQMTAVWNNFDDGSKSLEYYADVMTALGAATASSTDEIAEGLEKFASVADTVGLSYEYATSALATVTATTRQSADVVGNAFKTLFARIQGLQLGETLDDGTDLNKYSQALYNVGVNIKDTNGDMKSMDAILDELGRKWNTLGKDQQMALAQTVAGVRQYTQMIALMDNWDFFQKNLSVAKNAEGTLQEQANIYAESWEAAQKRVQAAAETIYQELLNDKFFININNAFAGFLGIIEKVIKSVGGLQGVLAGAGTLLLKIYGSQLKEGINNAVYSMKMLTSAGRESIQQSKTEVNELLQEFYQNSDNPFDKIIGQAYASQGKAQEELIQQAEKLDESQRKIASTLLDQHKTLVENTVQQAELARQAERQATTARNQVSMFGMDSVDPKARKAAKEQVKIYTEELQKASRYATVSDNFLGAFGPDTVDNIRNNTDGIEKELTELQDAVNAVIEQFGDLGQSGAANAALLKEAFSKDNADNLGNLFTMLKGEDFSNLTDEQLNKIADALQAVNTDIENASTQMSENAEIARQHAIDMGVDVAALDVAGQEAIEYGQQLGVVDTAQIRTIQSAEGFGQKLQKLASSLNLTGNNLVSFAQKLSQSTMMATNMSTTITSLCNGTMDLTQALTSITMILPGLIKAISSGDIVTIVLTGVLTAIQQVVAKMQEAAERAIEFSKVSVEAAEAIRGEVEANEELYDSYMELYQSYQEGVISKEELYDITDKLVEIYDLEGGAIAKLTGQYDGLTESVKNARKEELERELAANKRVLKERPIGGFYESASGKGHFVDDKKAYVFDPTVGWGPSGSTNEKGESAAQLISRIAKKYGTQDSGRDIAQLRVDTQDPLSLINYYKTLDEAAEELAKNGFGNSDEYKRITDELEEITPAYKDLMAAFEGILGKTLALSAGDNDIANATKETIGNIIENMKADVQKGIDNGEIDPDTDVDKAVETYIASLNNDVANEFLTNKTLKKAGLRDNELEYYNALSKDDKDLLVTSGITFDEHTTEEEMRAALATAKDKVGSVSIPIDMMSSLNETILKGKDVNKNDWESLLANIPESAQDLLGDRTEFNNAGLAERLQIMQQVNQEIIRNSSETIKNIEIHQNANDELRKQYDEQLENLKKQYDAISQSLKLAGEQGVPTYAIESMQKALKNVEDQIDEITAKRRVIEIVPELSLDAWHDELNAAAELTLGDINTIKTAVELIGEGWTIAADDVRQFAELMPRVAAEAEHLADGTLKLSQEQVALVLNGNQEIINSNKEVIVSALDDKLAQLRAEQNFQKRKEEILRQILANDRDEADYEGQIRKALLDYKTELEASGIQVDAEAWNEAMRNAATGSNNIISSLEAVNQAVQAVHNNVVHMMDANYQGAMDQVTSTATASNTGSESWTPSVDIDDSWLSHQEELNALQEELNDSLSRQKELATEIAETEGLRAQILKGVKETSEAIERVNSGQAGKADTSKSKSSSSSKKDKEEKKWDDEFDRYWAIKKAIDAVDRAVSKLDKDQQNLYGYELINSLKQENQLLEQQKANYEALYAAQQQEAAELRNQLGTMGVMFDASGAIINYAEATAQALAAYNLAIQQYNAGLIDETTLGVAERAFEQFKSLLDRYDTLYYQEMQETQEKLDDIWRQELANNLKAWEVEVQLKLDMKELRRGWNDFIKEVTEDFQSVYKDLTVDMKNLLDDAKTYLGKDGSINTIISAIHDVTAEIDKMRNGGSSDMFESISQAQEKLKELNEELQSHAKELHDLWKEAWDVYLDGIDQVADKFDDIQDRFEKINDELDFQKQLIELLYGDEAYKLMSKYYEGQEKNLEMQISSLKTEADMWKRLFDESGATMDNQADWTEDQKKYYEEWMEAQGNLNDLVLEYIKLLKDDYLNTVSDVLKELETAISGSSLSQVATQWERISAHADKYYDSVEGAYEIQTLANKIDRSISQTSNLKAQQKLQKLREQEIEYLREKENLTEYDLQAAEARYQIALKEIALEDAQNNKTSMKLTRNEQGNWSYQYIADEQDLMTKRQDLLDAFNELYQLASDAYEANLEALQDLQQQYLDSAREIYENENLTEEEREQQLLELREWYFNEYALLAEENSLYRDDLASSSAALLLEIYEQDREAYEAMTEEERALVDALVEANISDYADLEEKLKDNYKNIDDMARDVMKEIREDWTSGAQTIADLWNADKGASVKVSVINAYTKIQEANKKYQDAVDAMAVRVERDFSEEGIMGAIERAEDATNSLRDATIDLVNEAEPYLNELRSFVDQLADAWRSVQDEIMAAIDLIQEYLRYVGEARAAAASGGNAGGGSGEGSGGGSSSDGSDGGSEGGSPSGGSGEKPTYTWTWYNSGGKQKTYSGTYENFDYMAKQGSKMSNNGSVTVTNNQSGQSKSATSNSADTILKWQRFSTGGYTGEWGSDGKLAMLHQKELVLNQDDTKNFLEGIQLMRDLATGSVTDAVARSVAGMIAGLSQMTGGLSRGINTTNNNDNNTNNNTFNITAEFPNANDVETIREAILGLPNAASQWLGRNTK